MSDANLWAQFGSEVLSPGVLGLGFSVSGLYVPPAPPSQAPLEKPTPTPKLTRI